MAFFRITGEYLTDTVRDMVISGNWRGAMTVLTEDIEGLAYDQALSVLKGDKRLCGSEHIEVVDEAAEVREAYCSDVQSVYVAGRLVHAGKRYKAYAKVSQLPPADSNEWKTAEWKLTAGRARFPRIRNSKESDLREYIRPYCHDADDDLIFAVDVRNGQAGCGYVLFERDHDDIDLPVWMGKAVPDVPQVAFDSLDGCISEYGPSSDITTSREAPTGEVPIGAEGAAIEAEAVVERSSVSAPANESARGDWHTAWRRNGALALAQEAGFDTIEAFSAHWREKVLAAIAERGDTWETFAYDDAQQMRRTLRYPRNVALRYALARTAGWELAPDWDAVCPMGLKMENDNPVHTDLWLALGHDLDGSEYEHDAPRNWALSELAGHLQKQVLNYSVHVLTAAGKTAVQGTVVRHDDPDVVAKVAKGDAILWVPHAGEEFAVLAGKSVAVLCNAGGRLAHLVIVGRETGIPVVRIPEGSKPVLPGARAWIDLKTGELSYSS